MCCKSVVLAIESPDPFPCKVKVGQSRLYYTILEHATTASVDLRNYIRMIMNNKSMKCKTKGTDFSSI